MTANPAADKGIVRLALIRHGLTKGNLEHRFDGITDRPLCPAGREELAEIGVFPAVERVYVSPLLRARQTAALLFPRAEQRVVKGLGEMNFGCFEGKNHAELEGDPLYQAWLDRPETSCPGGESVGDFNCRACTALLELLAAEKADGLRFPLLPVLSHGGTIMALLDRFAPEGKSVGAWKIPNGGGYLVTLRPEGFAMGSAFESCRPIDRLDTLFSKCSVL